MSLFCCPSLICTKISNALFCCYVCSIKKVSEFVTEGGGTLATSVTLAGSITGSVALDAGIMIVQRSAAELFCAHKEGLTWDEDFDTTDMLVVNDDEIRITMTPVPGKPAQQAHDLHKLAQFSCQSSSIMVKWLCISQCWLKI